MKKILKTRYIAFLLALLMGVGIFFPYGGALADGANDYGIDLNININKKNQLIKDLAEGGTIRSSARQVKIYKLDIKKDLTEDEMLELAKTYHESNGKELSIKEAEDKLKKDKLFVKDGVLSENSKLVYDGKLVDEISLKKGEDPKLDKLKEERISIKGLEKGYYLIKETDESKKIADSKLTTYVVKLPGKDMKDKKILEINAKETKEVKKKSIKLIKVDYDRPEITLKQVEFELYRKEKDSKDKVVTVDGNLGNYTFDEKGNTSSLKTNDKGEILVENLPEGTYYFKEIKQAPGYDKANVGKVSSDLKPGDPAYVFKNKNTPILRKIDAADKNKYLKDAVFKLYKKDGTVVKVKKTGAYYEEDSAGKEELVTDDNGAIYITELKDGEYYLEETKAPDKYILSKKKIEFKVKDGNVVDDKGEVKVLIVENKPETPNPKTPKGGYNFVKIDTTSEEKRLGGAKFTLWKVDEKTDKLEKVLKDGQQITLVSKDNGEFSIDGLEYGEYALKEVEAPENHIITEEYTRFKVDAASSSLPAKKIKNKPFIPIITTKEKTPKTVYTPREFSRIITSPLVKTGDIRILVMAVIGLILLIMGIKLVNSGERVQRV